jgi:hypothetical protein
VSLGVSGSKPYSIFGGQNRIVSFQKQFYIAVIYLKKEGTVNLVQGGT